MIKVNAHPGVFKILGIVAVLFGLLTLKSGGLVLFVDGPDRAAAGNYVPFVLWFNFIAGFFYIAAGIGLWKQYRWAGTLSLIIAASTLLVFLAFGYHISQGGAFEQRTLGAMTLRSSVWVVIAIISNIIPWRHPDALTSSRKP